MFPMVASIEVSDADLYHMNSQALQTQLENALYHRKRFILQILRFISNYFCALNLGVFHPYMTDLSPQQNYQP